MKKKSELRVKIWPVECGFTFLIFLLLNSCNQKNDVVRQYQDENPLIGTWQLITGTVIENNDTTLTDYTKNQKFIKIINDSHFAFLNHDLMEGKDSINPIFVAGGGTYTLTEDKYVEHLEYCNYREWENNKFEFNYTFKGDTLIFNGIEKIENLEIERINVEKYVQYQ